MSDVGKAWLDAGLLADELLFLRLIRNKVDLLIPKVSINTPLYEISRMLTDRIMELEQQP